MNDQGWNDLIELYKGGRTITELARGFAVSPNTIIYRIKKTPGARNAHEKAVRAEKARIAEIVCREYLAGSTFAEIAEVAGCCESTALRIVDNNPKTRAEKERRKKADEERANKIRARISEGGDIKEIARDLGVTEALVRYYRGIDATDEQIVEWWLKGMTYDTLAQMGVPKGRLTMIVEKIPADLRAERARKREIIQEGFFAGLSDEEIAEEEDIPLEEVRNVTVGFKRDRPNLSASNKRVWFPVPLRGGGNPQLKQFDEKECTLQLRPGEWSRYIEVRNYRIQKEAEMFNGGNQSGTDRTVYITDHLGG